MRRELEVELDAEEMQDILDALEGAGTPSTEAEVEDLIQTWIWEKEEYDHIHGEQSLADHIRDNPAGYVADIRRARGRS